MITQSETFGISATLPTINSFTIKDLCTQTSSIRRILKRGGGGGAENSKNLRRTKLTMNIVSLEFSLVLPPKLGEDQKKKKKKVFTQN